MLGRFNFLRRAALLSVLACLAAVGLALPAAGSADNSQGHKNNNQGHNGNGRGHATAVTCGDTISTPGRYFLAADCGPREITITASDVTLKLDGHTMTGSGFGIGVFADDTAGPISGLKILGPGTITNYGAGVELGPTGLGISGSTVRRLTATNNGIGIFMVNGTGGTIRGNTTNNNHDGIEIFGGTDNRINANQTNNNTGRGIFLFHSSTGNTLSGNTADNNTVGIMLQPGSTGNRIKGNTALGNSSFDLSDGNPTCDNVWRGNDFVTANQSCIH